ncbi:MAG: hypothetical protein LC808_16550 [Actinobacteria bacterium]|nr:hypothetical protein [Actinomycetota bacterium]
MASKRGDERPQWLDVAVTVLPPLSLITALLVYFAWMRRIAFATALGLNEGLIEELSIQAYLLRSTWMFFPLLVASIGLLLWLWADRVLRRWVCSSVRLQAVSRISWALLVSAVILVLGTVLVPMVSAVAKSYVLVAWPFVVALAVLVAAYGASLRHLAGQNAGNKNSVGRRWASKALIGLMVSLLLFAGMDNFAQVVGRGRAERIIEQPQRYTQPVRVCCIRGGRGWGRLCRCVIALPVCLLRGPALRGSGSLPM